MQDIEIPLNVPIGSTNEFALKKIELKKKQRQEKQHTFILCCMACNFGLIELIDLLDTIVFREWRKRWKKKRPVTRRKKISQKTTERNT